MNCSIAVTKILLISTLLFPARLVTVGQARSDDPLNRPLPGVQVLQDMTTRNAFATLMSKAQISGGITNIDDCSASAVSSEPKHSYSISGLTLRQALDAIVADDSRYRWLMKDAEINLVPSGKLPEVLMTRIPHFEVNQNDSAVYAAERLFNTVEVKRALSSHRLTRKSMTELIIGGAPPDLGQHLVFKDATVMEILNALVRANKFPLVWQYTETSGNCKKTYDLEWPIGSSVKHLGN